MKLVHFLLALSALLMVIVSVYAEQVEDVESFPLKGFPAPYFQGVEAFADQDVQKQDDCATYGKCRVPDARRCADTGPKVIICKNGCWRFTGIACSPGDECFDFGFTCLKRSQVCPVCEGYFNGCIAKDNCKRACQETCRQNVCAVQHGRCHRCKALKC